MISTTIRLDFDIDPVKLGARSGLLWHDRSVSLAGLDEALRIRLSRPRGAQQAQEQLSSLVGSDEVSQAGTGPVGFSAMPFARSASAEIIVPRLVVGRGRDGRCWLTVVQEGSASGERMAKALKEVAAVMSRPVPAGPDPTSLEITSVLEPERWKDIVAAGVARINAGELNKVVLAREILLKSDHPLDPAVVLDRLRLSYANAILFSVNGFLGASPELLVARSGDTVMAHPLAGTAPRGADAVADATLAAELLASTKNQWEHRVTIDWLLNSLLPFCSYVDAEPEPSIVTLANVHHLGTRVEGRLSSPPVSVLELVAALHPTPAVGGDPQGAAIDLIAEIERADRGFYAGPVGWFDGAGNGSFAVGIRSAAMTETDDGGTLCRIFSGCGMVGDSDPVVELAETRSKLQAMLGAFVQP